MLEIYVVVCMFNVCYPGGGKEVVKWLHYDDNKLHVSLLMDLLSIYQESVSGNITEPVWPCQELKLYRVDQKQVGSNWLISDENDCDWQRL